MQFEDWSEREFEYFECHYVSRMGCFLRKCHHRAGWSDRRTRRFVCASAAPLPHADAGEAQGMLCGVRLQVLVSVFFHFRISSVLVGASVCIVCIVSVRLTECACEWQSYAILLSFVVGNINESMNVINLGLYELLQTKVISDDCDL